jgi:hypothetical protein
MSSNNGMVVEPATPERKDAGRAKYHLRQVRRAFWRVNREHSEYISYLIKPSPSKYHMFFCYFSVHICNDNIYPACCTGCVLGRVLGRNLI